MHLLDVESSALDVRRFAEPNAIYDLGFTIYEHLAVRVLHDGQVRFFRGIPKGRPALSIQPPTSNDEHSTNALVGR